MNTYKSYISRKISKETRKFGIQESLLLHVDFLASKIPGFLRIFHIFSRVRKSQISPGLTVLLVKSEKPGAIMPGDMTQNGILHILEAG
jgi:hypothetical protein